MRSSSGLRGARPGGLRAFERALWIAGALGLGWCALVIAITRLDEAAASRRLDAAIAARRSAPPAPAEAAAPPAPAISRRPLEEAAAPEAFGPPAPPPSAARKSALPVSRPSSPPPLARGAIIARIRIEKIGLSVVAREGDDSLTLQFAVGHIPGTPIPPRGGNAAFAGHRDRQFRSLGRLQPNDAIRLTTEEGEFLYRVEWTAVVDPDALWVLDPTPDATLTLVTCFPFGYVGSAPDRFVVRARRVES